MEKEITISMEEYNELLASEAFLLALMHAGVDSWPGYQMARNHMDEDDMENEADDYDGYDGE